jgi:hypothetical protein
MSMGVTAGVPYQMMQWGAGIPIVESLATCLRSVNPAFLDL